MTCTVAAPALPAGLTAQVGSDATTCLISGAPTATAELTTYTLTATNAANTDTATVIILVNPALAAPAIANFSEPRSFEAGASIDPVRFENTGGGSLTACTVPATPEFPKGLSLDISSNGSTCVISGIPAGPMATTATIYTITASNTAESDTATVSIAITIDEDLPLLQPPEFPIIHPLDERIGLVLDNSGAMDITDCTVEPVIPEGITVEQYSNGRYCIITGMVTEESALTGYTIKATNDAGFTLVKVYLGFSNGFAISDDDDGLVGDNTVVIVTDMATPSVPNTSVQDDGEGASPKMRYSVEEADDDVDDDDGEITVTVTEHNSQGVFTTLFEDDPNSTLTMDFRTFMQRTDLVFEIRSEDWKKYGESGVTDGFSYRIDHLIPGGMTSCDCDIDLDVSDIATGTWTTVFEPISTWLDTDSRMGNMLLNLQYVKTGIVIYPKLETQTGNNGADGDVEFKLRNIRWEIRTLPDLVGTTSVDSSALGSLTVGLKASIRMVNNGGGFLTSCAEDEDNRLPDGLSVAVSADSETCVISGTPTEFTSPANYPIIATNSAGSKEVLTQIFVGLPVDP